MNQKTNNVETNNDKNRYCYVTTQYYVERNGNICEKENIDENYFSSAIEAFECIMENLTEQGDTSEMKIKKLYISPDHDYVVIHETSRFKHLELYVVIEKYQDQLFNAALREVLYNKDNIKSKAGHVSISTLGVN